MPDTPPENLALVIESILFVAERPVEVGFLARATNVSADEVSAAVEEIAASCQRRGVRIQRTGTAVQMVTAPEATPYVQRFLGVDEDDRLSKSALATLTIIAYKQPITRSEIEKVLGKNCDWGVATLRARGLISEVGRAHGAGRPYLYGTTFSFLEHFGLEKPSDLPPLPELEEEPEASSQEPEDEPGEAGEEARVPVE